MHIRHRQIIEALKKLENYTNPWLVAIHETLPNESLHVTLVDQLASQAFDDVTVMTKIVGIEITELLVNRKLQVI